MIYGWVGLYIVTSEILLLLHFIPIWGGEDNGVGEILSMGSSLGSTLGHLLEEEVA